ncbi:hypothetical protein EDD16DRAFT_1527081 [Pisolithus croceorrhizus]|nr:hypothetical protein EDD16DRAFT_1527081 [Pisolithus croceorrhizus]
MATAGLTMKATWAELYAGTNPKTSDGVLLGPDLVLENLKDYYYHQMKHYESHKDEEEFPDLWVEIQKFWSESISSTKDMSSMAMAQTWCNMENIHVFGCVIYTGNDETACQAQGIFAGSSLCMQLAVHMITVGRYKVLNSMATIPLPTFAMLSGRSYDHVLALKPQESTCDRNRYYLYPKLLQIKLRSHMDRGMFHGRHYWICCLPIRVPAISQHFNVKCLTADELCVLTVPFLKEQMGNDYHMETRIDDDDEHGDYIVPEPASSFSLKPWTADQLALVHMMNPKAFEIPLVMDTFGQPLCLLSDLQAFLKVVPRVFTRQVSLCMTSYLPHPLTSATLLPQLPPSVTKVSQGVSGGFAVWWSMSIAALLIRDITIIPLMKMTIPTHAISTTELWIVTDSTHTHSFLCMKQLYNL